MLILGLQGLINKHNQGNTTVLFIFLFFVQEMDRSCRNLSEERSIQASNNKQHRDIVFLDFQNV